MTRVVCETHPAPSPVQVKAVEPARAGSEHEGFLSLGLWRHWGLLYGYSPAADPWPSVPHDPGSRTRLLPLSP